MTVYVKDIIIVKVITWKGIKTVVIKQKADKIHHFKHLFGDLFSVSLWQVAHHLVTDFYLWGILYDGVNTL